MNAVVCHPTPFQVDLMELITYPKTGQRDVLEGVGIESREAMHKKMTAISIIFSEDNL